MSINLNKGQTVNLAKPNGGGLTRVRMGLGWDAMTVVKKSFFGGTKSTTKSIDLDASAVLCAGDSVVDIVYFGQLASKDGSIHHTGDNLTGEGDGDDESIIVDLPSVNATVDIIFFVVNSYSGESFAEIENAVVRVVDSTAGDQELVRYSLTGTGPHTAMVMAKLTRQGTGWSFTAIGHPGQGRRLNEVVDLIRTARL
ncbi:MAG: TerD family protein [Kineosporiaceae bacterium]|nr:TerD family protein [Kineosporiaceae bacterium]MBK7624427.1 TerD family protein [Kineosporiaceae bacterium]MBK8077791.1 TerD family protein [Kineosporiaceae bacterium]